MCTELSTLESVIEDSPEEIQVYLIKQIAKIIAKDKEAKKNFAANEGLRKVQQIKTSEGSKLQEAIDELVAIYPADIAQFYSAEYEQQLVNKVWIMIINDMTINSIIRVEYKVDDHLLQPKSNILKIYSFMPPVVINTTVKCPMLGINISTTFFPLNYGFKGRMAYFWRPYTDLTTLTDPCSF